MAGDVFKVMLSSTFLDLKAQREAVSKAILGQGMLAVEMAANALIRIGRRVEEGLQRQFSISDAVARGISANLATIVRRRGSSRRGRASALMRLVSGRRPD